MRSKRIGSDPLDSLNLVNEAVDVRRTRRELTADELTALLTGTRASARTFRGLAGEDRFMLYLVAAGTGFRANALANLTPADLERLPPREIDVTNDLGLVWDSSAAVLKAPTPAPNSWTSGVLMPNRTAATRASRPPFRAGRDRACITLASLT